MAVGFALSLYAADRFEFGVRLFLVAWLGVWVAWEAFGALRVARVKEDAPTLALSVLIGLLIPATGLALAALLTTIAP